MREQDGEEAPAHHARRPMNAFLIFCKRHRSVVRDKYPNLENRSITKILGEWWANLEKDEKACYTSLAKQYKDAFFSANPDFKWYKLPAPPLRTLSSRPNSTGDKAADQPDDLEEPEKTNNNSTKYDFNTKANCEFEDKPPSMFTPGKLADEAQMGGLSSLLSCKTEQYGHATENPYYSPYVVRYNDDPRSQVYKPQRTQEESIRELQNALSETTKVFENFDERKNKVIASNGTPKDFTNQEIIDQIVNKRYSFDEQDPKYEGGAWTESDRQLRSGRSCKGKRYQEFMAVGGLLVNKRQRRDNDEYDASCSWDPNYPGEAYFKDESRDAQSPTADASSEGEKTVTPEPTDEGAAKVFKAADFDLDAKIKALPSLSLEKFQQKKRENKRKKKSKYNSYPLPAAHTAAPRENLQKEADTYKQAIIGSQKRKPRKISITRLEINSTTVNSGLDYGRKNSPEIKFATEAPNTGAQTMELSKQTVPIGGAGLDALATLAEVAAITSKIEETNVIGRNFYRDDTENISTNYADMKVISTDEYLQF